MALLGIWIACIAAFIYGVRRWRLEPYTAVVGALFISPSLSHIEGVDGIFAVYPIVVGLPAIIWVAISSSQAMAGLLTLGLYGLLPYLVVVGILVIERLLLGNPASTPTAR
ncbi:MAG: hypothetical protein ACI9ON_001225 [Limisphaerales bacterium]|jgi:hypothetical protein